MMQSAASPFLGRRAVLGTMHDKDRVIAPLLESDLGVSVSVASFDTDSFGTFSREVPRAGSQLDAARAKARAALRRSEGAAIALSSEGSFGPHPRLPFLPSGRELVLLLDGDVEIVGWDMTTETNYYQAEVTSTREALAVAHRIGAPTHGVLVVPNAPCVDSTGNAIMFKGLREETEIEEAVAYVLRHAARARIESDMRAHMNPTRMRSIERATKSLTRAARCRCPLCARPGYRAESAVLGLPCGDCGRETDRPRAEVYRCSGCMHAEVRALEGASEASPFYCTYCNP